MNPFRRVVLRLIGVQVRKSVGSYPPPKRGSDEYEQLYTAFVAESRRREKAERELRVLLDALEFGSDTDDDIKGDDDRGEVRR